MKTRFDKRNLGVRFVSITPQTVRSTKPTTRLAGLKPTIVTLVLALAMALGASLSFALAQTRFSVEGANRFVNAKDWNGLGRYATDWTRAEPNNPTAWYYLGNNYATGLKRPEAAIPAFQKVVRLDPNHHGAWGALGAQLVKVRRFEDAINALKRATELEPRKPSYWNNLAVAYRETNQINLALAALDSNMKLAAPHGTWADWHNLGTAYRNLGRERDRQSKAVIALRQSVKLNPRNGEGWNSLGASSEILGNYDEALRCYKQADALGNQYARANYNNLKAALAAAAAAAANQGNDSYPSSSGGNSCSSFSGPVAAACNQGDQSAMGRYQNHQETGEDKRKYGVQ
jgi:tetratricopeptide (TPR) repeat protein